MAKRKLEEAKAALNLDPPDCFKDELYVWLRVSFGPRLPHHEEKSMSFKVKGRLNQISLGLIWCAVVFTSFTVYFAQKQNKVLTELDYTQ